MATLATGVFGKVLAGVMAGTQVHQAYEARKQRKATQRQTEQQAEQPIMPDREGIQRARRRAEAARVGTGRASTILSQNSSGTLGPQ